MSPRPKPGASSGRRRAAPAPGARVVALDAHRIRQALAGRTRYQYVRPRVEPEGRGWKIVSPNCSRNIDPQGGDIDIAWFEPGADTTAPDHWRLFARDHGRRAWVCRADGLSLAQALALVCADPDRVYWP